MVLNPKSFNYTNYDSESKISIHTDCIEKLNKDLSKIIKDNEKEFITELI